MASTRTFHERQQLRVCSAHPTLGGKVVTLLATVRYMHTGELWVQVEGGSPLLVSESQLSALPVRRRRKRSQ